MGNADPLADAQWRKSSCSGNGGNGSGGCVETAVLTDGQMAVRDSKNPASAALLFTRTGFDGWLNSIKAADRHC